MKGLVITLYIAVFLALFGLDFAIDRYYSSVVETEQKIPYPGYRAALELAVQQLEPPLDEQVQRQRYIDQHQLNLSLETIAAVPLPSSLAKLRDQGEIIMLESTDGISLYKRIKHSSWLLRLDINSANTGVPQRTRYGLTLLFYIGVAAILLLWITPLLRGVRQLNQAAKKMGEGQLNTRVATGYGDYLQPLKTEFNSMAAKLESLNENNQLLTQAVSHELRTPLARMRFAFDLLQSRENAATRIKDIQRIEADIDAMDTLITELLNYARLDKAPNLQLQRVAVEALIQERCDLVIKNNCSLLLDLHHADKTAILDPKHFSKVIDNLLQNAYRHAHSQVAVHCSWSATHFHLYVDDDGPGIAAEHRESIFKPFQQLPRSATSIPAESIATNNNFGLGLAIVARLIHWHGGTIYVTQSDQLGGASFCVNWPLASRL